MCCEVDCTYMYMQLHIHVGAIASSCSSKEMDLLGMTESAAAFRNAAAERRHLLTLKLNLFFLLFVCRKVANPFEYKVDG